MKKLLLYFVAVLVLVGCQPREESNNASSSSADVAAQRKEASRKLTAQGVVMLGQKDFKNAVTSLDAAIKFDPTNQDPYLILGEILLKSGEFVRAAEFLDNAVKNFPDNGMMFYLLSLANKENNKKLPAVLAARRSFELFKAANDQSNAQNAAALMQQIINIPDAETVTKTK